MGAYDVGASKFFIGHVEHVGQVVPFDYIALDEDGARGARGVCVHEFLGFGSKTEVGDHDVALVVEEETGEGEIDAWWWCEYDCLGRR